MNFHGPFRMLRRRCCAVYNNLPRKFRASNYKSMHEKLLSSSLYPFRTISCPSMRFTHIRCDPPLFALRRRPFSTGIKRILKRDRSKWTLDDILAMGSWFFVGNTVFVLLATTSSVSLLLFIVNSLQFQGYLAKKISQALTNETGVDITFKEAIVPRWRDGMIRMSAVHARRQLDTKEQCTHFDITIDRIDLSLDLMRWLNGRGLVREMRVRGIRGLIDRRHLDFSGMDPSEWLRRRQPSPSDLDLSDFRMQDCFLTVLDYNDFRPYTVQFHDMHCPRFRTHWLLYDVWNADTLVGQYDSAVFSLSRPRTEAEMGRPIVGEFQPGRSTKIRVYGLPIDFLNSGDDSPFGWIYQGTVDFDMFFTSGRHSQDKGDDSSDGIQTMVKIAEQMRDIRIKLMGEVVEPIKVKLIDELRDLSRLLDETLESSSMQPDQQEQEQLQPPNGSAVDQIETTSPSIVTVGPIEEDLSFLMDIRFNNIRAEMPSQTSNTTSLLVRPIIAYLNAQARNGKSATPPVTVKFKIPLESFSGSQTVYQCGFMSNLSETLTVALSKRVLLRYNNYLKQGKRRQRKERSKESSSTQNDAEEVGWYTWAFGWITPSQSRHRLPVAESKNDDPVLTIDDVEDYDESEDDGADTNDDDDDDEQDESWIGRIATGMSWWSLQQLGRQIVYSWESGRQTGSMYPRSAEERYDEMYNEIIWGHP